MKQIRAVVMIEVLGKPADHVKSTLIEIADKIGKLKDVEVKEKKVAEPKEIQNKVFTSFIEIEMNLSLEALMHICFEYLPSHVEIITPEELRASNVDFSLFFSELVKRLHQYDELARTMLMERDIMIKQIEQMRQNPALLKPVENNPLKNPDFSDPVSEKKKNKKN